MTISARERLILAAERLMAEKGPSVSLRDIAIAAEQRNNSAVQYHFDTRDGLIRAVVDYRIEMLEPRRRALLAEYFGSTVSSAESGNPVHGLLEVLTLPMFELGPRFGATHYARFHEQVRANRAVSDATNLSDERRSTIRTVMRGLDKAMAPLPAQLRERRLRSLPTVLFSLLADHERAVEDGRIAADDPTAVAELLDMANGLLRAPVSAGQRGRSDLSV